MTTAINTISSPGGTALVSVIITTYNHAAYLPDAIESVLNQTWPSIELIVIDDGSTDNTAVVARRYPRVIYRYQQNKGLSAARNAGASASKGTYLVFLDADDMLYPEAITMNVQYFIQHPDCGFVSGGHDLVTDDKKVLAAKQWQRFPQKDHYKALLCCDYISMHGAVMYRRDIFASHQYDETLSACEDYDFYLQVARDYPVFSHNRKLAAYRKHENSMSGNVLPMYKSAMKVMRKQENLQNDASIKACCHVGKRDIRSHYAKLLLSDLKNGKNLKQYLTKDLCSVLALLQWNGMVRLGTSCIKRTSRRGGKSFLAIGRRIKRLVNGGSQSLVPRPGHLWMKDLNRTTPLNRNFGAERGGAVDDYYIAEFLTENKNCIKGDVLESPNSSYAQTFGGGRINSDKIGWNNAEDRLVIIPESQATAPAQSPQYDSILLIQFLHRVYDYEDTLRFCFQSLKKGGVLLLTVPGVSTAGHGNGSDKGPYWNFTGNVINRLLAEYFDPSAIQVHTYGNVLAAASLLYGMGKPELTRQELSANDPNYQIVITAKVIKR